MAKGEVGIPVKDAPKAGKVVQLCSHNDFLYALDINGNIYRRYNYADDPSGMSLAWEQLPGPGE